MTHEAVLNGKKRGFTFVELATVISIIAILCAIAIPLAANYIKKSKEAALKKDLYVMRECIDKYHAAFGKYPKSLEELVEKKFLRAVPPDPVTGSTETWKIVPSSPGEEDVYNVKSGADGIGLDGAAFETY